MLLLLLSRCRVRLCETLWTVAHQAPLCMGFSRLLCPWDSPVKNTELGCRTFLQGIFPTQISNLHHLQLLRYRQILYHCATGEAQYVHSEECYVANFEHENEGIRAVCNSRCIP
ncbi:hypothetical protein R6Z07F_014683 [Ovis aries]